MLHICISDGEKNLLQRSNLYKEDDIISFCLILSYGNIKDIINIKSKKLDEWDVNIQDKLAELNNKIKDNNSVRIWYSTKDNEDVCNVCFLIYYLSKYDKLNIYLSDVSDNEHPTFGSYDIDELSNIIDNKVILSDKLKTKYIDMWTTLEQENSDIRVYENNIIKSYNFEYLDNLILNLLKSIGECKYYKLIGICMASRLCNFIAEVIFKERIDYLIKIKRIKITKTQLEKNFINETKEVKYIALNI